MKQFQLMPAGRQKSFYGKAVVTEAAGIYFLTSYESIVAEYHPKTGEFFRDYNGINFDSNTTMKHVNSFRALFNLGAINKAAWRKTEQKNGRDAYFLATISEYGKINQ